MKNSCQIRQRGSLLVVALTMLVILSLASFSVGYTVRQKLQVAQRLETRGQLRAAGEAAMMHGAAYIAERMNFEVSAFHALNQPWAASESLWKEKKVGTAFYSMISDGESGELGAVYGFLDEERKININRASSQILQKLFQAAANLSAEEARMIVAAIQDWKDEDDDLTDGGAESADYQKLSVPYPAQNAPFQSLRELLWVQGITPSIFDAIEPYLTLNAEKINLNTAPAPVLLAMGMDTSLVEKIMEFRKGRDKQAGTSDDGVFSNLNEAPDILSRSFYLDEEARQNMKSILNAGFTLRSENFKLCAEVRKNHQSSGLRVSAIVDSKGGVSRWFEEFF